MNRKNFFKTLGAAFLAPVVVKAMPEEKAVEMVTSGSIESTQRITTVSNFYQCLMGEHIVSQELTGECDSVPIETIKFSTGRIKRRYVDNYSDFMRIPFCVNSFN